LPTLETSIWQPYKDEGLVFFSISSSTIGAEDPDALADYVDAMGMTMPVLLDVSADVYQQYNFQVAEGWAPYPREYIIDRQGIVIYTSPTIDAAAISAVLEAEL